MSPPSGEHRLELSDTLPCPPPDDPEADRPTWPRVPAAPAVDDFDDEGLF